MIKSAEVIEVLLKDDIQNYYTIRFKFLDQPGNNDENTNTASPLNAHIKSIPVPGEIVLIVTAASSFAGNFRLNEGTFYYLTPVNIQSNINYNGVPTAGNVPQSNGPSYANAALGASFSNTTTQKERIKKTFEQLNGQNALQLFEGDVSIEGRSGNSIRLSSTINYSSLVTKQPTWTLGNAGDPIMIISNTKKNLATNGFRIEDINKDDSSIYLTSTQRLPLTLAGPQTITTLKIGAAAKNLSGKQIIMNSDRIVLNAKVNEIFLSSKTGISLSSKGNIVLESSKAITLSAPAVNLTSTALYSAVNGEVLQNILRIIVNAVNPLTAGALTPLSATIDTILLSSKVKL